MTTNFTGNLGIGRKTPVPQTVKAHEDQIENNAGGFSFQISPMDQLRRFLILGTSGGTYYVNEQSLTESNYKVLLPLIQKETVAVVDETVKISAEGRSYKNDAALFIMALCFTNAPSQDICGYVAKELNKVARTYTHLAIFVKYVQEMRGWGRALRHIVQKWYYGKNLMALALQMTKYTNREGFTQTDMLRLGHIKPKDENMNNLFRYSLGKESFDVEKFTDEDVKGYIRAVSELKNIGNNLKISKKEISKAVDLIENHKLPWETIPSTLHNYPEIWEALIPSMGITALFRNLARMTANGTLAENNSKIVRKVCETLTDKNVLKLGRIHPIQALAAYLTYSAGHGSKGKLTWNPLSEIVHSLDEAFYMTFENIEPSGKSFMLGLDVSGSMCSGELAGIPGLSPRVASCCMAMAIHRSEKECYTMAFSSGFQKFDIGRHEKLNDVIRKADRLDFSSTDCSIPMLHAAQNNMKIDCFVVLTDSETFAGRVHPHIALEQYSKKMGIRAKLIVVGMESNIFTIAQPGNPNMLDVAGFDTNTPMVVSEFAAGKI